jgi:hypothetical protein
MPKARCSRLRFRNGQGRGRGECEAKRPGMGGRAAEEVSDWGFGCAGLGWEGGACGIVGEVGGFGGG